MLRRALLFMTMALAAMALTVSPAFAGEDPPPDPQPVPVPVPVPTPVPTPAPTPGAPSAPGASQSAALHVSHGCAGSGRAKASVSGTSIASVSFFVDGRKMATRDTSDHGAFSFSMSCSRLSFGTHRGRAVATFERGAHKTLAFRIVRPRPARPQFTG